MPFSPISLLTPLLLAPQLHDDLPLEAPPPPRELLTVAERSDFHATGRHADVVAMVDALASSSPLAHKAEMGSTGEGRSIPLLIVADPPVADVEAARAMVRDGRVLCLVFANIHAGEVCGKEATLILARQLLREPDRPDNALLLKQLVMVFAPIFNADGNERMAPDNRPGQIGPDEMGIRPNAEGLDLNRDYMKLESPEVAAMVRFLDEWDPHLVMDLHTTNGSHHRYALTWSPPLNPAGPVAPLAMVRDRLLPDVSRRLFDRTGISTFAYGNFENDHTRWATYSSLPRFGAQYHGLRGHLSILSEAYSHIPFQQRVIATLEFVRECLTWTADHAGAVRDAHQKGRADTIARGRAAAAGQPDNVGIRHVIAADDEPATLLGWVEVIDDAGRSVPTEEPCDYVVEHFDHFEPVVFVKRPAAYLIPPELDAVVELLRRHGIAVERVRDAHDLASPLAVETYAIDAAHQGGTRYLGHATPDVEATPVRGTHAPAADAWIVPMDQALGTLAMHLLEPEAEDSLAPLLLPEYLRAGSKYPVLRIVR